MNFTPCPKGQKAKRIKPKRETDVVHLAYVRGLPCEVCHRKPSEAHHLLRGPFSRGWGLKAPDRWTIPLCQEHHNALHMAGNETEYLSRYCIDGPAAAARYWSESR